MITKANQLLTILLFFSAVLCAQQDAQYTQFMYNKLGFNPAVAGSPESTQFQVAARQQWLGLDEAPTSQVATFNTPITAAGTGVAARLSRVTIGLEQQYNVEGSYAYRFAIGRGTRLGIGLSASARYFNVEYQNARPTQGGGIDTAIPGATTLPHTWGKTSLPAFLTAWVATAAGKARACWRGSTCPKNCLCASPTISGSATCGLRKTGVSSWWSGIPLGGVARRVRWLTQGIFRVDKVPEQPHAPPGRVCALSF